MIFRPEHAEDISYVYEVNQTFESVSNLYATKKKKKDILPTCFVCISTCSVNKKRCALLFFYGKNEK